jgi:hypothetical protein
MPNQLSFDAMKDISLTQEDLLQGRRKNGKFLGYTITDCCFEPSVLLRMLLCLCVIWESVLRDSWGTAS